LPPNMRKPLRSAFRQGALVAPPARRRSSPLQPRGPRRGPARPHLQEGTHQAA
ncbi:hypothetical protein BAE44_0022479, partial [Dichanthelium oligosanthes]